MHILFNGCSYTYGDELTSPSKDRYSTVVSNHYKASHTNLAKNARSNDAIARTTMQWFNHGNTCDLAVIQWTVISRVEGYNTETNSYENITIQKPGKWNKYYGNYYNDQLGTNNLWKNCYLLEQYFLQNNIKYIFLFHDKYTEFINERQKQTTVKGEIVKWREFDQFTPILESPCIWRDMMVNKDFYFVRASYLDKDDKSVILPTTSEKPLLGENPLYTKSGGHPSILGHKKIAEHIVNYLDNH